MRTILLLLALSFAACDKSETPCECATLRDKSIGFSAGLGSNIYRYVVDECDGRRVTYTGYSSIPYDGVLIGDEICRSNIW